MADVTGLDVVNGRFIDLTGWSDSIDDLGVRHFLFGELVRRTIGVVDRYHSDLYHDADWLRTEVNGPMTFYWQARESGTNISDDRSLACRDNPGAVHYKVDLKCTKGMWSVRFTVLQTA